MAFACVLWIGQDARQEMVVLLPRQPGIKRAEGDAGATEEYLPGRCGLRRFTSPVVALPASISRAGSRYRLRGGGRPPGARSRSVTYAWRLRSKHEQGPIVVDIGARRSSAATRSALQFLPIFADGNWTSGSTYAGGSRKRRAFIVVNPSEASVLSPARTSFLIRADGGPRKSAG